MWSLLPYAHTHTTSSHIPLFLSLLSSPTTSVPPSLCPSLWLSLPLSKAVVTVRLPHIIPPRWKLNEGGLTQLTEACFEGCNRGKLHCQILFHGLWICAAEARTQQSLSHAEAQTTGLISPPDLWKLHFFFLNYLFPAAKDSVGQWSQSEVDGRFVAFTAVCSTHGCVQLCEDAKAVRPQDQILRLAAPFRDLERFTGTPQWMGHGHQ